VLANSHQQGLKQLEHYWREQRQLREYSGNKKTNFPSAIDLRGKFQGCNRRQRIMSLCRQLRAVKYVPALADERY
jgi:hypothetical protein